MTSTRTRGLLPPSVLAPLDVLSLDTLDPERHPENPAIPLSPDALACIMYTSGSTGEPKGVMQTHRTVVHRALDLSLHYGLMPEDRVALLQSCAFTASIRPLFGSLLAGATLHVFDVAAKGPHALAAWLARERITVYASVPSVFRHLAGALTGAEDLSALRLIRLVGEPLTPGDVELYCKRLPPEAVLVNAFGASESGNITTYVIDAARPPRGSVVPAGWPDEDKELFLIDAAGARVSPGEVGEIMVRTRYASPGYWRRPDRPGRHSSRIATATMPGPTAPAISDVCSRTGVSNRWGARISR